LAIRRRNAREKDGEAYFGSQRLSIHSYLKATKELTDRGELAPDPAPAREAGTKAAEPTRSFKKLMLKKKGKRMSLPL
jgi:hypothetical protein